MLSGERSDILRKKEKGVFALKNQMLLYFFATMLLTLIFTALITRVLIPKLRSIKMGQKILDIGPRWHKSKEGTPTMGGIAFIIASVFTTAIIGGFAAYHGEFDSFGKIACVTALIILNGLIGFADDYLKFVKKQNEGLRAYQKFFLQSVTAILFLAVMTWLGYINSFLFIPFFHISIDFGAAYYIIAFFLITGIINSVNLTDGIDGLAASVTFVVSGLFAVIAFRTCNFDLGYFSALAVGSCLGFLIYNAHPAKIFMGDTGSLFLGGTVVGLAFLADDPLLLIVAGLVYIIESLSDIIQVAVYKLTADHKRFFKMAPIHHHFERCGWSENKIVGIFSLVTAVMCVIAYFGHV